MRYQQLHLAANLAKLRRVQIASYVIAIVGGAVLGGLFGRTLDHAAADGNVVSRMLEPIFGTDPALTIATCAYLGVVAGLLIASMVNRLLQFRAQRAVARVAQGQLLSLLDEPEVRS